MMTFSTPLARCLLLILLVAIAACAPTTMSAGTGAGNAEAPFTYHEFDGVVVYYRTDDLGAYRRLLPDRFKMPAEPLVMAFVMDYYKMDAATDPYREAAVFLLVAYQGQEAWHCITMPVTSEAARQGGVYYLGYPKIMGDVTLARNGAQYTGELKLNRRRVLRLTLEAQQRAVSPEEVQMFERMAGVRTLNILNGEVYEPRFGNNNGRRSLLQVAAMAPDKFQVLVGKAELLTDVEAARSYSPRLGDVFSLQPDEIVLAYYLRNKFVMRFAR